MDTYYILIEFFLIAGVEGGFATATSQAQEELLQTKEGASELEPVAGCSGVGQRVRKKSSSHAGDMSASDYYKQMCAIEERKLDIQEKYYQKRIELEERNTKCREKRYRLKEKMLEMRRVGENASDLLQQNDSFNSDILEKVCNDI